MVGVASSQAQYPGLRRVEVGGRQFQMQLFGHRADRPTGALMLGNALKRQEDARPFQRNEVIGGKHHLQVQHVLVEAAQLSRVGTIDRDCTQPNVCHHILLRVITPARVLHPAPTGTGCA